jgi:integrase
VRRWVDEIRRRLVGLEILAEQPLFDLRPAAVGDLVKACCEKAKLDSAIYSGHSLRAGHVTEAFARGIDAATIMEVTGHTKIDMLLKYKREANKMKLGSAGRIGK